MISFSRTNFQLVRCETTHKPLNIYIFFLLYRILLLDIKNRIVTEFFLYLVIRNARLLYVYIICAKRINNLHFIDQTTNETHKRPINERSFSFGFTFNICIRYYTHSAYIISTCTCHDELRANIGNLAIFKLFFPLRPTTWVIDYVISPGMRIKYYVILIYFFIGSHLSENITTVHSIILKGTY